MQTWLRRCVEGRASLVNCCSTRTVCQLCTPKGCPGPFMPGLKSMALTILRVPWMSNTQCAAVSTCFSPISVPVHSSALRGCTPNQAWVHA